MSDEHKSAYEYLEDMQVGGTRARRRALEQLRDMYRGEREYTAKHGDYVFDRTAPVPRPASIDDTFKEAVALALSDRDAKIRGTGASLAVEHFLDDPSVRERLLEYVRLDGLPVLFSDRAPEEVRHLLNLLSRFDSEGSKVELAAAFLDRLERGDSYRRRQGMLGLFTYAPLEGPSRRASGVSHPPVVSRTWHPALPSSVRSIIEESVRLHLRDRDEEVRALALAYAAIHGVVGADELPDWLRDRSRKVRSVARVGLDGLLEGLDQDGIVQRLFSGSPPTPS